MDDDSETEDEDEAAAEKEKEDGPRPSQQSSQTVSTQASPEKNSATEDTDNGLSEWFKVDSEKTASAEAGPEDSETETESENDSDNEDMQVVPDDAAAEDGEADDWEKVQDDNRSETPGGETMDVVCPPCLCTSDQVVDMGS